MTVWSALESEIEELREKHEHHTLPGVKLPESMGFTSAIAEAMNGREVLVTAVPSVYVRQTAQKMRPYYQDHQVIVNVAKGIEDKTDVYKRQIQDI